MEINYSDMMYRINCLASDLDSLYHQAAQKLGISDSVMMVLYLLYEKNGKCLLNDIRKETSISKTDTQFRCQKVGKRRDYLFEAKWWQSKNSISYRKRHGICKSHHCSIV